MPELPAPDDEPRLPSLEALKAFDTLLRLGSLERAAGALHISASAVAKRVGTLEQTLGVSLLLRGSKPAQATPQGKEYLAQLRPALALLAGVPLHQRASQRRLRLRVVAPPTFARLILVPALPAFCEAHPELELELGLSVPYADAPAADAEVEIRHGPAGPADAPELTLMHDLLLPLASPALLAGALLRQPTDLLPLPLLRTPLDPWSVWWRSLELEPAGLELGPRLIDLGLVLEAALHGQGVMLARPSLARQALRSGALLPALGRGSTPWVAAPDNYRLLPGASRSPAAQAFVAWLQPVCRAAAAEGLALVSAPA